jgi:RimJ/RimL family protein N-acetyltransferase
LKNSARRSTWHDALVAALHPAIAAPLRDVATARLSVRRLSRDDTEELDAVFAAPEAWTYDQREPTSALVERQLRMWDECGLGACAVRELAQRRLVGIVGLAAPPVQPEVLPPVTAGWRFAPAVWGRGYATEATTALLDQAFTMMGLERVGCMTHAENRRSIAVAERLGMTVIGETSVARDDGGVVIALMLQVSRDVWQARSTSGPDEFPRADSS